MQEKKLLLVPSVNRKMNCKTKSSSFESQISGVYLNEMDAFRKNS